MYYLVYLLEFNYELKKKKKKKKIKNKKKKKKNILLIKSYIIFTFQYITIY